MNNKISIGGEYYYPPTLLYGKKRFNIDHYLTSKYQNKYFFFTAGGLSSLYVILDSLNIKNDQIVLLPSYLCSSMLIPFRNKGIRYLFYKVNSKLEIDKIDLIQRINEKVSAILFINYFGFRSNIYDKELFSLIKKFHIDLIEDAVQSFFSDFEPIGDFVFNSFRKFTYCDCSVIISQRKINANLGRRNYRYQITKTFGQWLKWFRIFTGLPLDQINLKLLLYSNKIYYTEIPSKFTFLNKILLSRINCDEINENRRENFQFLLANLNEYSIYNKLPEGITPIGFPVLIKNRDSIRNRLIKLNIFCPIHWKLPDEIDKTEYAESWYLSKNIMTIPINEKVKCRERIYFITHWKKLF